MDKDCRRNNYQKKKNNNEKHKLQKEEESQQNQTLIQSISQFSAQQLLKFLQEKYENYQQKSQKLLFKLNNQICKRLMRIPSQIDEKQFKKMKNILLTQNDKITDEQIKFIFDKKYLPKNLLKVFAIVQYQTGEIIVMKLNFNNGQQNSYIKKVCIQKVPQTLYHFPLHKRIKKQGIQIIERFFQYEKSLDNYEKT